MRATVVLGPLRSRVEWLSLRPCYCSAGGIFPTVRGPIPKNQKSSRLVRPTKGPELATSSPVSFQYATNATDEYPRRRVVLTIANSGMASGILLFKVPQVGS